MNDPADRGDVENGKKEEREVLTRCHMTKFLEKT